MVRRKAHNKEEFADKSVSTSSYNVQYSFGQFPKALKGVSLVGLYARYGNVLWEDGQHKHNVSAFISEINEILLAVEFSVFSQEMLDFVVSTLRGRGNSNATINRKMAALGKLLRKACKMGTIHSLPEFRRQKERAGRIRFLEIDEEDRLFAAIAKRSMEYHRLSVFLVDTGARVGEATRLLWNDVHDGRVTFWFTKSGLSRSVPLTTRALAAISVKKPKQTGPFTAIEYHKYRAVWNEAKLEAGLSSDTDVVPHVLRHTCASRLVRGGVDIRRVQMWLGHQTLQMTMRYAHLATHDLDMCVPILERR